MLAIGQEQNDWSKQSTHFNYAIKCLNDAESKINYFDGLIEKTNKPLAHARFVSYHEIRARYAEIRIITLCHIYGLNLIDDYDLESADSFLLE